MTDSLVIPARFCGPPGTGNGGYVCGRIAAYVDGPVTVTLRRPPPLATPMTVERDGDSLVRIHHGRTAEAASLARDTAILLGQMTASLAALPAAGDQCRVIAWPDGRDGRKLTAGSALLGPGGTVLAAARTVWLTVPRPVPVLAAEQVS